MEKEDEFGESMGMFGDIMRSDATAKVGAISEDSSLSIGLGARQLNNLGFGYGQIYANLDGEKVPVEVYNSFAENKLGGDRIWISEGLAKRARISLGDSLGLLRLLNRQGKINYECENNFENPFGQSFHAIEQPAEGVVAAIDEDGYNGEIYRIGLSGPQMANLGIRRISPPVTSKNFRRIIDANKRGQLDGVDYDSVTVESGGERKNVQVYNSFGMKSVGGCGVRVSSMLAQDLGLDLEDKVRIYKTV